MNSFRLCRLYAPLARLKVAGGKGRPVKIITDNWGYVWSIALYGSETWILRQLERKYLRSVKCGAEGEWRR